MRDLVEGFYFISPVWVYRGKGNKNNATDNKFKPNLVVFRSLLPQMGSTSVLIEFYTV
jgi:hypothetical protein